MRQALTSQYCAPFTPRKRAAGQISAGCVYRLPTEDEWKEAPGRDDHAFPFRQTVTPLQRQLSKPCQSRPILVYKRCTRDAHRMHMR